MELNIWDIPFEIKVDTSELKDWSSKVKIQKEDKMDWESIISGYEEAEEILEKINKAIEGQDDNMELKNKEYIELEKKIPTKWLYKYKDYEIKINYNVRRDEFNTAIHKDNKLEKLLQMAKAYSPFREKIENKADEIKQTAKEYIDDLEERQKSNQNINITFNAPIYGIEDLEQKILEVIEKHNSRG